MALGFDLSDEHRLIQKSMKQCLEPFADRQEELRDAIFVEKRFPEELWRAICDTGLLGSVIPEEYGGTGMGLLSMSVALESLAEHGVGNALLILTAMDASCIVRNGSEEMKQKYLPKMATGETKFCFAITEPNAGSNAFRMATLATDNGDGGFRINGEKVFITGADVADYMLLVCRTTSREEVDRRGLPKAFGMGLFIVDCKAPGISLTPLPTRGIEGLTQFTVRFDDVPVSARDMLGAKDAG
ncbi:MAG: acyl-CoA dehydrogenase family protein, partial [Myxococcota bacterium]|nr:acyl-CoA dehydrogenase family protein [Myxococcota bacterium]